MGTSREKEQLIQEIFGIQKKHGLVSDNVTYSVMFHSCDGDRERLKALYRQMVEVDRLRPNQMALQNILLGGMDDFMRQVEADITVDNEKEIRDWIDWTLTEMKTYKLSVSDTFRYRLNSKLSIIKEI